MPYKSQAQRRLFHFLVKQGKLAPETVKEYDRESKGRDLPEYAKQKAFGGQIEAKAGTRCPACDYPLDSAPVAMDAGEGCPRCGYGDAKDVPQKARGGKIELPARKPPDASIPDLRRRSLGTLAYYQRMFARDPTTENAQMVQDLAEVYAHSDPEFREEWRKNTSGRMGDLKAADRYAHGGEIMDETSYRARGGEMHCSKCGSRMAMGGYVPLKAMGGEVTDIASLYGDMKELYPSRKSGGATLDDGKIRPFGQMFARALKMGRR